MTKLYIGISGKMGSGKTTLSTGIMEALRNMGCRRVSLAAPIKQLQDNIYKDLDIPMEGEKDRDLLIALGLWGRGKHADFWLEQAINAVKLVQENVIICDDVRFKNEAQFFKDKGILMRIEGEQRGPNVDSTNKDNISETDLDTFNFDYYVDNRVSEESMIMSALYCVAQHLNISRDLMDQIASKLNKEA